MGLLTATALDIARSQLQVREDRETKNSGKEVDAYLESVGLPPGLAWCAAFMHWVFAEAARQTGLRNPFPRAGGCLAVWRRTEPVCKDSNPQPGYVYVLQHTGTTGHIGIVEKVEDGVITEISGNTNLSGSREGNAVARHTGQPEVVHGPATLLGYLDFSRAAQHPSVMTS
jgi:hypothetical protein